MALVKECRTCSQTKPISDFAKNPTGIHGVRGTCKECRPKDTRLTVRGRNVRWRYGIELDEFVGMYEDQGGKCAICRIDVDLYAPEDRKANVAHVDHCHTTGKIRALLCHQCNVGIGAFKEDAKVLQNAIQYIKDHS
jgi:hypothetical protein